MRTILLLAFVLTFATGFSQVENYSVYIFSNTINQGPSNVNWQVRDQSNVILFSGSVTFNAEINSHIIPIELGPGCYELRLVGNGVSSPINFFGNIQQNGSIFPPTGNLVYGTQVFEYPFCTNIVEEECQALFEIDYLGNGLVNVINLSTSSNELSYAWYLGDGVVESEQMNPQFQFTQNGLFPICLVVSVYLENVLVCSDEYCLELEVSDYFNPNCPNSFFSSGECANWIFELNNAGPETDVVWDFSGEEVLGGHFIAYTFPESGLYEVCATSFTEDCPEGAQVCEVLEVNDCGPQDCAIDIVATDMGNGMFVFTAYGSPEVYPMYWSFGDGSTLAATWVVEHVFSEPGVYQVCGTVESQSCLGPVSDCISIEVTSINPCTESVIAIDSFVADGGASFFEYDLIFVDSAETVASGVAQYSMSDPYFDLPVCLEDGCYNLVLCTGNIDFNWEAVNVLANNGLVINGWDPECGGNGRVYHLSLNSKCDQGCSQNEVMLTIDPELQLGDVVPIAVNFYSDLIEQVEEIVLEQNGIQQLEFCVPSDCYNVVIDVLSSQSLTFSFQIMTEGALVVNIPSFEIPENATFNLDLVNIGLPPNTQCVTQVGEHVLESLSIYPNPSQGIVRILGASSGFVEVYDTCGKRVASASIASDGTTDLSMLSKGMYILHTSGKSSLLVLE